VSRRIITTQLHAAGAGEVDTFFDKVIKYIPADIVAAWIAATGVIASGQADPGAGLQWIVFVFLLVVTPLWILRQTRMPGRPLAWTQALVATGAFAVWIFALGGPFAEYAFYKPWHGSLALIGYTLVVGLITPPES
jgi:hypothetical protein